MKRSKFGLVTFSVCAAAAVICGCGKKDATANAETTNPAEEPAVAEAEEQLEELPTLPDFEDSDVLVKFGEKQLTYGEACDIIENSIRARAPEANGDYRQITKQIAADGALPQIVDRFLVEEVIQAQIKARNLEVSDAECEEAISNRFASLPGGLNEETFAMLGVTEKELHEKIRANLLSEKLFENVTAEGVAVAEEEIKAFYDGRRELFSQPEMIGASHILIGVDQDAAAEEKSAAKAKAEALLAELKAGADFAQLATSNSVCPSREHGGDLGDFARGQMVPSFEEAAFALKVGELSDVVETQYGFHIIKKTSETPAQEKSFDEVKEQIKNFLESNAKQKAFGEFLRKCYDELKVELHPKLTALVDRLKAAAGAEVEEEAPAAAEKAEEAPAAVEAAPAAETVAEEAAPAAEEEAPAAAEKAEEAPAAVEAAPAAETVAEEAAPAAEEEAPAAAEKTEEAPAAAEAAPAAE